MDPTLNAIVKDFMMTLKQLHDDTEFDDRQVQFWVQNSRAVWIKNELNKNKWVSHHFVQDLGVLDVETVDATMLNISTDYKIKRTSEKLPRVIESHFQPAIVRVGPAMIATSTFKLIPYEHAAWVGARRFNQQAIYAFLFNDYIYLITASNSLEYSGMRKINIRGVFEDPTDVARFSFGNGTPCYTDSSPYPMSGYLISYMKDVLKQSDAQTMLSLRSDKINNSADDTTAVIQQPAKQQP